jgi:hypothetical protein
LKDDEPKVRAANPRRGLIGDMPGAAPRTGNIEVGPKVGASPRVRNPYKFWDDYYRDHDESPGELIEKLAEFRKEKQFADVEAALRGYLTHRLKRAEPWMYEMLAVSVKQRKGPQDPEIRTLLGYGAFKALQTQLPDQLLSVASELTVNGIYDKVGPPGHQTTAGELIDMVAKKVRHRYEPLLMSIDLAARTKDPRRMGDAVDSLLSLGWPGEDEPARRGAREQVEKLAKALREDGKSAEADALLARLPAALARDVYVRLSWEGKDDLDLLVDEPLGVTCQLFKTPRTIFGGAIVSNGYGSHPEEVYVCPRGFDGTYTVRVEPIYRPENAAKVAQLEVVTHEGTPEEKRERHTINLDKPEPVRFKLAGGRRKEVLPMMPPPSKPPVLVPDDPRKGPIRTQPKPGVAGAMPPAKP